MPSIGKQEARFRRKLRNQYYRPDLPTSFGGFAELWTANQPEKNRTPAFKKKKKSN